MPTKKKAPVRAHKLKSPGIKERAEKTTVVAPPRVGGDTTRSSAAAATLPPEDKARKSPVKIHYPARERRMSPEGRRGRYAEKAPPGTRTKMIKIIYDRKAEMAKKRQNAIIGKILIIIAIVCSLYYGAQHAIDLGNRGFHAAIETLDLQGWWNNVSTKQPHAKPQTKTVQPKQSLNRPATPAHSRATIKQAVRKPSKQQPQPSQRKLKKTTYGQTPAYSGTKQQPKR